MTAIVTNQLLRARYREAAAFVINFGKHEGCALDEIAATDAGLGYLVWLRASMAKGVRSGDKGSVTYEMLGHYLDDPAIANAVANLPVRR